MSKPVHDKDAKLTVENLMLVNFPTCAAQTELPHLRARTGVVAVESCARQIWIGRKQDFTNITDSISSGQFSTGKKAYTDILRLITGISSKKEWDTESSGQNNRGWDAFAKTHPMKALLFKSLRQSLTADSRLILREILSNIQPHTDEIISRKLSGYHAQESVLIVTARSRSGNLSGITERLVRTLNNKPHFAREIALTHPDEQITYRNLSDVFDLFTRGIVSKHVTRLSFDEIGMACDIFDRVYVDMAMGQNPETDLALINAWENRSRDDNTLTHLRGEFERGGFSNDTWSQLAGRKDVILPERIRSEKEMIISHNKALIELAEEALNICADERAQGHMPTLRHLKAQLVLPGLGI